jgi:hypothetical protein
LRAGALHRAWLSWLLAAGTEEGEQQAGRRGPPAPESRPNLSAGGPSCRRLAHENPAL